MAATLTNLLFHIIFSTKDREPLIREAFRDELEKIHRRDRPQRRRHPARHRRYARPPSPHHEIRTRSIGRRHGSTHQGKFLQWVNENHGEPGRFARQAAYGSFFREPVAIGCSRAYVANQQATPHPVVPGGVSCIF